MRHLLIDPTISRIYWLGPALGAVLAVGFYRFVKLLEYETANPGQDFNEKEDQAFEFEEENAATAADVERPTPGLSPPPSGGQLGKSKTTPDHNLNPNQNGDGRYFRPDIDADPELHPGFADATYRNSLQAEEGRMQNGYNAP
jgi:hypothetical protein